MINICNITAFNRRLTLYVAPERNILDDIATLLRGYAVFVMTKYAPEDSICRWCGELDEFHFSIEMCNNRLKKQIDSYMNDRARVAVRPADSGRAGWNNQNHKGRSK